MVLKSYREQHLSAGDFDRRVQLQAATIVRDSQFLSESTTWATEATLWAKVEESAEPGESTGPEGQITYAKPHRITIHWRADVSTDKRLLLAGRPLQIVGMAAIGRRRWIELSCVEWRHQQP